MKVRPVIKLIKGQNANRAVSVLEALNKKGAHLLKKVLQSAIANAKNKGYDQEKLVVLNAVANSGPSLKRYRAESFGRASLIKKRMSHILVELDAPAKVIEEDKGKKKPKKKKVVATKAKAKKRKKHGSKS
jgi:large subunit ribosomal protein L22